MRQELEKILGEELRYLAIETRDDLDLTQRVNTGDAFPSSPQNSNDREKT